MPRDCPPARVRRLVPLFAAALVLAGFCSAPAATDCPPLSRLYVDASVVVPGDGSGWATAFIDLQDALALARACTQVEEIWVAEGSYRPTPTTDRSVSFELVDGVAVYGGFVAGATARSGRDPAAHPVVLTGNIGSTNTSADNSYHVVRAADVGNGCVLDGVTIRDGRSQWDEIRSDSVGAGMLVERASPVLRRIRFENNWVGYAGAALAVRAASDPVVEACTFRQNHAEFSGGAIFVEGSAPVVVNSVFLPRDFESVPTFFTRAARPVIVNCTFAGVAEGAILSSYTSRVSLQNSIVWESGDGMPALLTHDATSELVVANSLVIASGGSASWNASFGTDLGGNLDVDPRFVDPTSAEPDLRLSECSPALDRGDPALIADFPLDHAGAPRVQGGAVDLGALEGAIETLFYRPSRDLGRGRDGAIEAGDFDGDGDLDLILVGGQSAYEIGTTYLRNYDGQFLPRPSGLPGLGLWATLRAADYDRDGDLDVAVAGRDDQFMPITRIYRNERGQFVDSGIELQIVERASLDWADFDRDGDPDLLCTGTYQGYPRTTLYANTNGRFERLWPSLTNVRYGCARWGDYDNDGDPDIALFGENSGRQLVGAIYRNDDGTFVRISAPVPQLRDAEAMWVDYDSDGDLDLFAGGRDAFGQKLVLLENEDGKFRAVSTPFEPLQEPAFDWADFDADGDRDLVLLGIGPKGTITRVYEQDRGTFRDVGAPLDRFAPAVARWIDLDDDSRPDLLISGRTSGTQGVAPYFACATPAGVPAAAPVALAAEAVGSGLRFTWEEATGSTPGCTWNLRVGTAPGLDDVVRADSDPVTGARRFVAPGNRGHARVAEVRDLLPGTYYWSVQAVGPSLAGGEFAPEQQVEVVAGRGFVAHHLGPGYAYGHCGLDLGDYDADGDLDIAWGGFDDGSGQAVSVILRNDDGQFVLQGLRAPGSNWGAVAWGDYDGDGDLDLYVGTPPADDLPAQVYRNDAGTFVVADIGSMPPEGSGRARWSDFDGNGSLDLLVDSPSAGMLACLNRGLQWEFMTTPGLDADPFIAEWADYDDDGDLDIFFLGDRGRTSLFDVFENVGGRFAPTHTDLSAIWGPADWGDYDGDGDLDILGGGSGAHLLRNDGGRFSNVYTGLPSFSGDLGWVDVDVDGTLDVVVTGSGPTGDGIGVFLNDGGTFSVTDWGLPHGNWLVLETGDVDGDGDPDVVLAGETLVLLENVAKLPEKPPAVPQDPQSVVLGSEVRLSWNAPSPDASPTRPASWNLRIGTSPGSDDVMPSMARADGRRLVSREGNAWLGTARTIRGLAPGRYYWSVQALGPSHRGGPFTEEKSFEILVPSGFVEWDPRVVPAATDRGVAAWADIESDGDLDLFLVGESATELTASLYRNDGYQLVSLGESFGGLEDAAGIWGGFLTYPEPVFVLTGRAPGGDARSRLFVGSWGGYRETYNRLPAFTQASLAWVDVDRDGTKDLFVNGVGPDGPEASFFRWNDPEWRWDRLPSAVETTVPGIADFADYDGDGDFDLLLAGAEPMTRVYRNDGGQFTDLALDLLALKPTAARWGDDDGDGDLDILLCGDTDTGAVVRIYRNEAGRFVPLDPDLGGIAPADAVWADLDLDGDLDLVVGARTEQHASAVFLHGPDGYAAADWPLGGAVDADVECIDFDGDADLDLFLTGRTPEGPVTRIYVNQLGAARPLLPPPRPRQCDVEPAGPGRARVTFRWSPVDAPGGQSWRPSYALRVGRHQGGADLIDPLADAQTGWRRLPEAGNAGRATEWTVELEAPATYSWSVQAVDNAWRGGPFAAEQTLSLDAVATTADAAPRRTSLQAPAPNPFNPRTTLHYELATDARVTLKIYDLAGRLVRTLVDREATAGRHAAIWEGRDDGGRRVASGVYLCRMEAGAVVQTRRLVLVK